MILTQKLLLLGMKRGIGFTKAQARILDVEYPLKKGWKATIVGKDYPDSVIEQYLAENGVSMPLSILPESLAVKKMATPSAKYIVITIHEHEGLKGLVEIDSDEYGFIFSRPTPMHFGLQHSLSKEKEDKLSTYLKGIQELSDKIDQLHK